MSLNYIPRVTQLDSAQLDEQVEELLKHGVHNATKYLEPGMLQRLLPELELLIRTWIFKNSICNKKATFGQQMLSLKYQSKNFSASKLYWYFGYTIGLRYLKDRVIYSLTSNTKIQKIVHSLETFQVVSDILNFLRFIQNGKHPLVIDFILGLELSADKLTRENLSDFSWTRELLWNNFIELIGTVLSIMNIFGVRRKITNVLKYMWWRTYDSSVPRAPAVMTLATLCSYCSGKPVLPHVMGCSHIFCYYCLKSNKMADADFVCPKCYFNGSEITRFEMKVQ